MNLPVHEEATFVGLYVSKIRNPMKDSRIADMVYWTQYGNEAQLSWSFSAAAIIVDVPFSEEGLAASAKSA